MRPNSQKPSLYTVGCDPKLPEIIRSQVSKEVDQGTCGIFLAHPSLCKYELPVQFKEEDPRFLVYPEDYERLSFFITRRGKALAVALCYSLCLKDGDTLSSNPDRTDPSANFHSICWLVLF